MTSSDSHIDKPQHGYPKRAELPGVNTNRGAQSINTERCTVIHNVSFTYGVTRVECCSCCLSLVVFPSSTSLF